jgi:hypothetical protein
VIGPVSFPSAGAWDGFVARYTTSGGQLLTHAFGGPGWDSGLGIAVGAGKVYVVGTVNGMIAGAPEGFYLSHALL